MTETERCARYIEWLADDAENSTAEQFYTDMAAFMRSGATVEQFVENRRIVRPEVNWIDPRPSP